MKRKSGIDINGIPESAGLGAVGEAAVDFASDVLDDVTDAIDDVFTDEEKRKKLVWLLLLLVGLGGVAGPVARKSAAGALSPLGSRARFPVRLLALARVPAWARVLRLSAHALHRMVAR